MTKHKTVGNLALAGYEDIFRSSIIPMSGEQVVELPLSELYPPEFHPFQVNDDEAMERLVRSVKQYGVREPGLARPREDGGYELIAGNRRKRACELAGLVCFRIPLFCTITALPVVFKYLVKLNEQVFVGFVV